MDHSLEQDCLFISQTDMLICVHGWLIVSRDGPSQHYTPRYCPSTCSKSARAMTWNDNLWLGWDINDIVNASRRATLSWEALRSNGYSCFIEKVLSMAHYSRWQNLTLTLLGSVAFLSFLVTWLVIGCHGGGVVCSRERVVVLDKTWSLAHYVQLLGMLLIQSMDEYDSMQTTCGRS